MTNTLKAAMLSIDAIALDLETVPRAPDSVVDRVIAKLRLLSRHAEPYKRDQFQWPPRIEEYRKNINDLAATLSALVEDTPSGTIKSAIEDLTDIVDYLGHLALEKAPARVESIQVPPSLKGEPAEALDKPARQYSLEDQARINAGLEPFTAPQPTKAELAERAGVAPPFIGKKDASKGESIVQACAQIRGEMSNNFGSNEAVKVVLHNVDAIEALAFSKDTPTFALNANGHPLDDEQTYLIKRIKEVQRELLALAASTQNYLVNKQQRLKAACDADPAQNFDCEDVLSESQVAAYGAYRDFTKAGGYGWVDRGVSDVQVGVMALVRAVAGPTE